MRRLTSTTSLVLTAATIALGVSACGGDTGGDGGDNTFDVVVVAPMSGQFAAYGDFTRAAYQASVNVVNARGGILGQQVEMTVVDDKGDPTTGVSALNSYLSTHGKPDLVFPGATSPEVQGTAPFLAQRGILSVSGAQLPTMNDPEKYPLYFSTNTDYAPAWSRIVDHVASQGWTKIGLITSDDVNGDAASANIDKAVAGTDLTVEKVVFPPDALAVTAELEKLRAGRPDVVVMDAVGERTLHIVRARADIGWDVPVVGGVQSGGADFAKVDASALEGVQVLVYRIQQWVPEDQRSPAFTTFYDAILKEEDNQLTFSNYYYGVDYDCLQVVAVAAEQARSTDPEKIAGALENLQQPADGNKPWVLFDTEGFSPDNHLNVSTPDDFAIVQATPLQQGFTGTSS